MISARFFGNGGFEVKGHAGAAESGSDIVCAAVSSAVYLTANTITDVLHAKAVADVSDSGRFSLRLTQPDEQAEKLIVGLRLHLKNLAIQYPERIRIIYGGNNNA